MAITIAHGGDIEYIKEASFGAGLPASGSLDIPSDAIMNIELSIEQNLERIIPVNDHDAVDTAYHSRQYTLTIEYLCQLVDAAGIHQLTNTLEYGATLRTSHILNSYAFVYKAGHSTTDDAFYYLRGGKINSMDVTWNINETIKISVEIWGTSMTDGTAGSDFTNYSSLTASAAVGNAFEVYGGGAITRSGAFAAGVKSGTLTINNNLERVPNVGSQDCVHIAEGEQHIGFVGDVVADSGGKPEVDDLLAASETAIVLDTGTTANTSQKFTLNNPSYNRMPIIQRVGDTHMLLSVDIGAETITHAAYT